GEGFPPLGAWGDRAALAGSRALPGGLSWHRARRSPQLLPALLPPRPRRAAARQPARRRALSDRRSRLGFAVAGGALVILMAAAFAVGRFSVTPAELLARLWSQPTRRPPRLPPPGAAA